MAYKRKWKPGEGALLDAKRPRARPFSSRGYISKYLKRKEKIMLTEKHNVVRKKK